MLKMAFRNIQRNFKRSLLSGLSIFIAGILVGVAQGWMSGMVNLMVDGSIKYSTGHIRITNQQYDKDERFLPIDENIETTEIESLESLRSDLVKSIEPRVRFGILLGHNENTISATGIGLDLEKNSFEIAKKLTSGRLEESGLYLSDDLAQKLEIKVGEDMLVASKTTFGGLNAIKLPLKGIYKMGVGNFDKRFFFIGKKDADKLLKLQGSYTEYYVYLKETSSTEKVLSSLKKELNKNLIAKSYGEQMGSYYQLVSQATIIYLVIEIIILFLASFVIVNTMMMAIYERIKEIGTMKALGFTDRQVFMNFTIEGGLIGILGGIPGALIGFGIIYYFSQVGLDFTSISESLDMPIETILKPKAQLSDLAISMLITILVPLLSAMIPARHTSKMTPAEALRK